MIEIEKMKNRITVKDSDIGIDLENQISELSALVDAYRKGELKEG